MLAFIRKDYWWPGMASDVKAFQTSCLGCALQTAVFHRENTIRQHITAVAPRTSWSVDCAPAISAKDKRVTIIVAVDDFSKFIIAGVLENLDSRKTAAWFLNHVLALAGKPDVVRCDNGNEFAGQFAGMLKILGIH